MVCVVNGGVGWQGRERECCSESIRVLRREMPCTIVGAGLLLKYKEYTQSADTGHQEHKTENPHANMRREHSLRSTIPTSGM